MSDIILINDNLIINQTIFNIFSNMKNKYTLVYNYNKYINIKYDELQKQFVIDFPRIIFKYKKKKIPLQIIQIYLKYKKRSLRKKIMLFCSQIIFAPIMTDIHKAIIKMNEYYVIAELDGSDKKQKHVLTQISNGAITCSKILRIIDISNNNSLIAKFMLHFTIDFKSADFLMLTIEFI
tara:strand:+ start:90 stop:626 length:537 start_codon:yes stop_codon:yes gene_type:complete